MQGDPRAYGWMAAAAGAFALMNFFARIASAEVHWTVAASVRALIGAGVALGFARLRGVRAFPKATRAMWLRSIFGTLAMACSFFALTSRYLPLADASVLNNTSPLILAVLAPLVLGERGGARVAVALPVAMIGVVLLVRPPFLFGHAFRVAYFAATPGDALVSYRAAVLPGIVALAGAFFSACAMLSLRRATVGESPEAIAAHFSVVAFVFLGVASIFAPHGHASVRTFLALLAAGVSAGFAQVAMTRSYRLEQASRVSAVSYLQPVAATLLGTLVLGEPMSTTALLGIACVVSSGLMVATMSIADAHKRLRQR
jgi:drug/metabolite transporter (DMT)-like permease